MARRDVVDAVTPTATLGEIARIGVVPVATIEDVDVASRLGRALVDGGLPCIEVTLRTGAGLSAIAALSSSSPDVLVGAGTVLTVEQAADAVAAGARFVVAPGYDDEVVAWCRDRGVLVLPGVMTPTEMMRARRAGLEAVKLFPASIAGGPTAIIAAAAVFPDLRFVPTGGIGPADLADYLRLDAVAAVGGSWIVDRELLLAGEFDAVAGRAADAARLVAATREGHR